MGEQEQIKTLVLYNVYLTYIHQSRRKVGTLQTLCNFVNVTTGETINSITPNSTTPPPSRYGTIDDLEATGNTQSPPMAGWGDGFSGF